MEWNAKELKTPEMPSLNQMDRMKSVQEEKEREIANQSISLSSSNGISAPKVRASTNGNDFKGASISQTSKKQSGNENCVLTGEFGIENRAIDGMIGSRIEMPRKYL